MCECGGAKVRQWPGVIMGWPSYDCNWLRGKSVDQEATFLQTLSLLAMWPARTWGSAERGLQNVSRFAALIGYWSGVKILAEDHELPLAGLPSYAKHGLANRGKFPAPQRSGFQRQ